MSAAAGNGGDDLRLHVQLVGNKGIGSGDTFNISAEEVFVESEAVLGLLGPEQSVARSRDCEQAAFQGAGVL